MDIRRYDTCKQYEDKKRELFNTLRLQNQLSREYEEAMNVRAQNVKLGIKPVVSEKRSIEQERQDITLQRQILTRNLQSIMRKDQTQQLIGMLNDDQVYTFNTYFGKIALLVKGNSKETMTANYLYTIFQRYVEFLNKEGGNIRPIPLSPETQNNLSTTLLDKWEQYSKKEIDPLTGLALTLETMIKLTAAELGVVETQIKGEVQQYYKMQKEDNELEDFELGESLSEKKSRMIEDIIFLFDSGETITDRRKRAFLKNIIGIKEQIPKEELDFVFRRHIATLKTQQNSTSSLQEEDFSPTEELIREVDDVLRGEQEISYSETNLPQRPIQTAPVFPPSYSTQGRGIRTMSFWKNNRKVGMGIGNSQEEISKTRYRHFGRYVIDLHHLPMNKFMLKTKTLQPVMNYPKKDVSPTFSNLIFDLLETQTLNKRLFNELDEQEKNYFVDISRRSHIDTLLGIGKSFINEDKRDKQNEFMKQFEIVKSEFIAGNNSPEILKELKQYLLKFVKDKAITTREANELLFEITCLS